MRLFLQQSQKAGDSLDGSTDDANFQSLQDATNIPVKRGDRPLAE
jgi:hypothetical protein